MKIGILLTLFFFSMSAEAQEDTAVRFHVIGSEMRVISQSGGWSEWKNIPDFQADDENITINTTRKTITWDFGFKDAKRSISTFKILSINYDRRLKDFHVDIIIMKVREDKKLERDYQLLSSPCGDKLSYILITKTKSVESRYYLSEE